MAEYFSRKKMSPAANEMREWKPGLTLSCPRGVVFSTTLEVFANNSEREKDNSTTFGDFS